MPQTLIKDAFPACLVCFSLFLATNVQNFAYNYIYFIAAFFILSAQLLYKLFSSYNQPVTLPGNIYLNFFILFLFWATASIFWSPAPGDSFTALTMFFFFPIAVILGFWSSSRQQHYFYIFLILLLLASSLKAGLQCFVLTPRLPAPGFFGNKNTNAIFISMIILPICAKFLSKDLAKEKQLVYGTLVFIGAFIISLTISRGAMLGLTLGVLLLLLHSIVFKLSLINFFKLISILGSGYLIAELLNSGAYWKHLKQSAASANVNYFSSGRTYLWQSGWEMFQDNPLLGWGLNMYHLLFPQYRHPNAPNLGQYVHNDYFQFLIELGPVGFLLFIGFLLTFLFSVKKLYVISKDKEDKLLSLGLISACIAVLAHSFLTFNLYQPAPLMLLGLYTGVLTQKLNKITAKNTIVFQPDKFTSRTGYFGLLGTFSLVIIYFTSTNAISISKTYAAYKNNLIALEQAEIAQQLTSYNGSILDIQLNIYINLLKNQKNKLTPEGERFLINRGINTSTEAINKNPYNTYNYLNRARLYLLADANEHPNRSAEINTAFNQAIKIDPYNLRARYEYVQSLMEFNEKQKAIQVYKEGLGRRYYGIYEDPIYYLQLLLSLISDSGDEEAIKSLKEQIDLLLNKPKSKGYYTLKAI